MPDSAAGAILAEPLSTHYPCRAKGGFDKDAPRASTHPPWHPAMTNPSSPTTATQETNLRAARAMILKEIGPDRLAALHAPNLALDLAAIFGSIALFVLCAWQLATGTLREPFWWLCLVVQGNLIIVMGILNHDAFVHRKLLAPRLRWVLSSILAWPAQLRSALYEGQHLKHHRALGTEGDTEMHKHALDTRLRRLVFASPALIPYRVLFYRSLLARQKAVAPDERPQGRAEYQDPTRLQWEAATRRLIWVAVAVSLFWDWRLAVLGYLLPLAVVTPFLNTLRIVLEHFDLDSRNPLWVGTFYRTGPLTRLMFWWGTGDCHMVHHYYASIPFYRMPLALRLMRPLLLREGVYEHRSLVRLLLEWFSATRGHWSVPAQARRAPVVKPAD